MEAPVGEGAKPCGIGAGLGICGRYVGVHPLSLHGNSH